MEAGFGLLGGGGGGGGVSSSGESTNGSVSTVTKAEVVEQDYCMGLLSSEVTSHHHSQQNEAELELGLGLSLGGVVKGKTVGRVDTHGSILTSKDLASVGSASSSSSASGRGAHSASATFVGTKRNADSVQEPSVAFNGVSQVVGWPPVRSYRVNSFVNHVKVSHGGESLVTEDGESKDTTKKKSSAISSTGNYICGKDKGQVGSSMFVKVNMDGVAIGRKVDLNAHTCYETLVEILEDMFHRPTTTNTTRSSGEAEHVVEAKRPSKLLDGSSDFVLTYEDKEGDWMLVGDVPWGMFLNTVKRLRIMRTSEVNGLAPRFENNFERQWKKPI